MNTWWLISYRWYYHVRPWETSTSPTITPWLNILSPENVTVTTELGDPIDRWTVPGTVEAPKFIWLVVFPYPSEKYDLVKVSWDGWNFPTEWKVMKNSMVQILWFQTLHQPVILPRPRVDSPAETTRVRFQDPASPDHHKSGWYWYLKWMKKEIVSLVIS